MVNAAKDEKEASGGSGAESESTSPLPEHASTATPIWQQKCLSTSTTHDDAASAPNDDDARGYDRGHQDQRRTLHW